jgi:hypothetical protein
VKRLRRDDPNLLREVEESLHIEKASP